MRRALSLLAAIAVVVAASGLPARAVATADPSQPADQGGNAQPALPGQFVIGLGGLPVVPLPGTLHPTPAPGTGAPDPQNITATVPPCGSDGDSPQPRGHVQLTEDPFSLGLVDLFAAGFDPGSVVFVKLEAPPGSGVLVVLATTRADGQGQVRITLTLPPGITFTLGTFVILVFGVRHGEGCVGLEGEPSPTTVLAKTLTRGLTLVKVVLDPVGSTEGDGEGCVAGSPVVFTLLPGGVVVGRTTADGNGNFHGTVTVPKNATLGSHKVMATCGDVVQTAPITVVAGGTSLPFTGANLVLLMVLALALVGSGAAASARGRRRRPPAAAAASSRNRSG